MSITILGITVTASTIGAVIHYGSRKIKQRNNHWKSHPLSIICLLATILLTGCGCFNQCNKHKSNDAKCDSILFLHWDSVSANLMQQASSGKICRLHPVEKTNGESHTIAGMKIMDEPQKMNTEQLGIILFLLRNEEMYPTETKIFKTLFSPYLAIELVDKKEKIHLLISYNTPEWAIVKDGKIITRKEYKYTNLLLQLGMEIYPDDDYLKTIYQSNKE